jgi:hypothetical protein
MLDSLAETVPIDATTASACCRFASSSCLAGDVFEELNEYDGNPEEDGDGGSGLMDDDAAAAAAGEQQQDGDS